MRGEVLRFELDLSAEILKENEKLNQHVASKMSVTQLQIEKLKTEDNIILEYFNLKKNSG